MFLLLHISLLWLCHVMMMFAKLKWPIYARKIALAGNCKYIHAASLILLTLIPIILIIVVFVRSGGFSMLNFPPLFCFSKEKDMIYYFIILPISVLLAAGSSLLAVIIYIINKVFHVYTCVYICPAKSHFSVFNVKFKKIKIHDLCHHKTFCFQISNTCSLIISV